MDENACRRLRDEIASQIHSGDGGRRRRRRLEWKITIEHGQPDGRAHTVFLLFFWGAVRLRQHPAARKERGGFTRVIGPGLDWAARISIRQTTKREEHFPTFLHSARLHDTPGRCFGSVVIGPSERRGGRHRVIMDSWTATLRMNGPTWRGFNFLSRTSCHRVPFPRSVYMSINQTASFRTIHPATYHRLIIDGNLSAAVERTSIVVVDRLPQVGHTAYHRVPAGIYVLVRESHRPPSSRPVHLRIRPQLIDGNHAAGEHHEGGHLLRRVDNGLPSSSSRGLGA